MGIIEQERIFIHLLMKIFKKCKKNNEILKANNVVQALIYEECMNL